MALPGWISDDIAMHLNKIARHFSNPKITLVVRSPGSMFGPATVYGRWRRECRAYRDMRQVAVPWWARARLWLRFWRRSAMFRTKTA